MSRSIQRRAVAWGVLGALAITSIALPAGPDAWAAPVVARPPQFVMVSFDNAGNPAFVDSLQDMGERVGAKVTFFASGVFMYDYANRGRYQGPYGNANDVGWQTGGAAAVEALVHSFRRAQAGGHELATHYMGHVCGDVKAASVRNWTTSDWTKEIAAWNTAMTAADELYGLSTGGALVAPTAGGRTPCLEGNPSAYLPAMKAAGYRYDASGTRRLSDWPSRQGGLWRFGAPSITTTGGGSLLASDYSFNVVYGGAGTPAVEDAIYRSLLAAFDRTYSGNRAPFDISAHTTNLMGGAFYRAEERLLSAICGRPEVRCATYAEVAGWLDEHESDLPSLQAGAFGAGTIERVSTGASGATAALVNVAMVGGESPGYVTADRCDALGPGPQAKANGNHGIADAVSNLSVVPVDAAGDLCLFRQSPVHAVVDLQGTFAPGAPARMSMVDQRRLLDTRPGATAPVPAGAVTRVATGHAGAVAALVNLTMTDAPGAGFVTADRCSRLRPGPQTRSNGNFSGSTPIGNLAVVPLDPDGAFCIYNSAPTHLVADIQATFSVAGSLGLELIEPTRAIDTRRTSGTPIAPGSMTAVFLPGGEGSAAALVNIAMVDGSRPGYVTAGPCAMMVKGAQARSNGNHDAGPAIANLSVVPLDSWGSMCIYNLSPVHLVVDVQGYLRTSGSLGLAIAEPVRVLETRRGEPGATR